MRAYEKPGQEPCLEDVLADPIVHAVMRRDRVTVHELQSVIGTAKARLATFDGPERGARVVARIPCERRFAGRVQEAFQRCCA